MKPLLRHQRDALAFLRRRSYRGAMFMEPGLGKTRVGYESALRTRRAMVMAPLNPALFVWPEQGLQWAPSLTVRTVRGTPQERARILFDERPDVAVMNYELAHWFYDEVRARRRLPYDLLILDESTTVKSSSSIVARALRALEPAFDAVIPMTGTPAENSLHDLWGQLWFVDRGEALGKKIGVFRERYCRPVMRENYVRWEVTRAAELRQAAASLCFVRRATDCLDMPELSFVDVRFRLSDDERKFYDRLRKTHVIELPGVEAFATANTGVMVDKARQTSSGFVYDDQGIAHEISRRPAKIDALIDAIDEAFGCPLLVGFWYQHSREMIVRHVRAHTGETPPAIDRHVSAREKASILAAWSRGDIPILLGQIQTVAYGLNMQSPDAGVLFYDLPWSHGMHWQFIRRIWRQGQKSRVVVRRLIADATYDGYVASRLQAKQVDEDDLMITILTEELI